jgi:hypothetical protein
MLSVLLISLVHLTLRSIHYWPFPRCQCFAVTEPLLLSCPTRNSVVADVLVRHFYCSLS